MTAAPAERPYSEACEENKAPILGVLRQELADCASVLEIGSGTGQHAVFFAAELGHLEWHTSDMREHHAGIRAWLEAAPRSNLHPPLALDVLHDPWPQRRFDAVFSANTAHIMSWPAVEAMFRGVGRVLEPGGVFCLYGPFSYAGGHTAESNARFDAWLRARDPASGVRDFEALNALAVASGLRLSADHEMPVNNRILVWRRDAG